jgi:hypothetical protein
VVWYQRRTKNEYFVKGTYINSIANVLQRVESDNFLEEGKQVIAGRGVREVCHSGGTGPGNNGSGKNTDEESTPDPVNHQQHCENSIWNISRRVAWESVT